LLAALTAELELLLDLIIILCEDRCFSFALNFYIAEALVIIMRFGGVLFVADDFALQLIEIDKVMKAKIVVASPL
jgi:hypothetical protein